MSEPRCLAHGCDTPCERHAACYGRRPLPDGNVVLNACDPNYREPDKAGPPRPIGGHCDLCGSWGTSLVEGICPDCARKEW
jgi:hypothetical protein